jgi:hypothetical protein
MLAQQFTRNCAKSSLLCNVLVTDAVEKVTSVSKQTRRVHSRTRLVCFGRDRLSLGRGRQGLRDFRFQIADC